MKRIILFSFLSMLSVVSIAQKEEVATDKAGAAKAAKAGTTGIADGSKEFVIEKNNAATIVKNQQSTGTCWSFSTTALLESQLLKNNTGNFDLSEMFTVRNIYIEKAKNYILRQGKTSFAEGGLGHDVLRSISKYGAMPEMYYSGYRQGENFYNHFQMINDLKVYLDSILKGAPRLRRETKIAENWLDGFLTILNENMGVPPKDFVYNNKVYTPQTFAKDVLKFNADDYINITSFTHQSYYAPYVLEVPDNFSGGMYYNIPLKEVIDLTKTAIKAGYSLMWDADVSNPGFKNKQGIGLCIDSISKGADEINPDITENSWNENTRQRLYENLTTQDDHLMLITGLAKSKGGKQFFVIKNSYGAVGPFGGYMMMSESYFAINTISLIVPKAALNKFLLDKLKVK